MQVATSPTVTTLAPPIAAPTAAPAPAPRVAVQMLIGMGRYLEVVDTGPIGRPEGYDSLANARRAAYMLSRGEQRGTVGVFEQDSRWVVRLLGVLPVRAGLPTTPLEIEGNPFARVTGVRDRALAFIVDGSTRLPIVR